MSKFLKKKKFIVSMFLILSFFSLSAVISTNFYSEPSYVRDNTGYYEKYGPKIGLTEKSKIHREFSGGYAGDAIHYIMIAMGRDDLSAEPYTYRLLVPKLAGFFAKPLVNTNSKNYEDRLFKKISFTWRGINIISCFLLILIPLIHFKKYIFSKTQNFEFPLILLMNVFNMGVIMTAPFSLVDIPSYVIITLGASFFFSKNLILLTLTTCIGIFVKEITMILMLPILFLAISSYKKKLILSILCLITPIVIFIIMRILISGDAVEMGLMRYDVKDPFYFYQLNSYVHTIGLLNFFARVFFSIGIIFLIFVLHRIWYKKFYHEFLIILILTFSVIILNLLVASAVIRVTQVVTPFLIFYILESIRSKNLKT